jgi:hypothetical protein
MGCAGLGIGRHPTSNGGVPFTALIGPDPLGLNNADSYDVPNRVSGCNPIHGGVDYLNLSCFALKLETPALAGKCDAFGVHAQPPRPIPGTCANLLGNGGRNSAIGPALVNFDMSFFKNNSVKRISEKFNVQFRMEIFNSWNHGSRRNYQITFNANWICREAVAVVVITPARGRERRSHRR